MRVYELIEARKNPEQNPKTSINSLIQNAVESAQGADIGGTTNLFVSFTNVDKLGINPKSKYATPIGIYAYPGEYVTKITSSHKSMTSLPFAGESPHVNLFKARGNIINIATISVSEAREYYKKITKLWTETSGESWKTSVDQIEALINEASTKAKFSDLPGGRLWYVTMHAARTLFAPEWSSKAPVAWNKLFRSIGIDGVVDYTADGGAGIIHGAEPSQAVFFTTGAITNIQRHNNRYSPDVISGHLEMGELKHQRIVKAAKILKQHTTPQETLKYLETTGGVYTGLIKSQELRTYILSKHPLWITYLRHPTDTDQISAIAADPDSIGHIHNPSEHVFISAYRDNPNRMRPAMIAVLFPKASEQLQMLFAQYAPNLIRNYVEPSKSVPNPVVYPDVIKAALETYGRIGEPLPTWLMKTASEYKIPFKQKENEGSARLRSWIADLRSREVELAQKIETTRAECTAVIEAIKVSNPGSVDLFIEAMENELEKLVKELKATHDSRVEAEKDLQKYLTGQ